MTTEATAPPPAPHLIDETEAARAADSLRARLAEGLPLSAPDALAAGVTLAVHRIERGAPGIHAVALGLSAALGADPGRIARAMRGWYEGARDLLDDNGRDTRGMEPPEAARDALAALAPLPPAFPPPAAAPAAAAVAPPLAAAPPQDAFLPPAAPRAAPAPAAPQDAVPPGAPPPDSIFNGLAAAADRAEAAALAAAEAPPAFPPRDESDLPDAEAEEYARRMLNRRRRRKGERRTKVRHSDMLWGAFFVPAILLGVIVVFILFTLPPVGWATGMERWEITQMLTSASLALGLWCGPLVLILPPAWMVWRRGRSTLPVLLVLTPAAAAFLCFASAFMQVRSVEDPQFRADFMSWIPLWGSASVGVALSILLGPRLRRFNRHAFRKLGAAFDRSFGDKSK